MIWSLHYGGSMHDSFCFCTVVRAVLSNSHVYVQAVALCPPGKWTSIPAPPLVTALAADPSLKTWIHASSGYLLAVSQGKRLLHCVILHVSTKEGRDRGMDLDVSYVCNPGLSRVWQEGEYAMQQSVLKLKGQLLILMQKKGRSFFCSLFLVRPSSQVLMGCFGMHLNFSACIKILAYSFSREVGPL